MKVNKELKLLGYNSYNSYTVSIHVATNKTTSAHAPTYLLSRDSILHNLYIRLDSCVIIATKLLAERPGLVPERGEELLFPQGAIGPVTKCAQ